MSVSRRKTVLVAVLGVSALIFASIGIVDAQQSDDTSRVYRLVERQYQEQQEQQRRADEIQRALAQEMRMRQAFRPGNSFFRARGGGMAGLALAEAEGLELTETQEQTIRDAQRTQRREEIRRDADIEIAELELEEMMEADTLELDTIEAHMRQIANLQVDERMAGLRLDRTVRDVLTVEQVDKLEEMSPERVIFETYTRRRNQ